VPPSGQVDVESDTQSFLVDEQRHDLSGKVPARSAAADSSPIIGDSRRGANAAAQHAEVPRAARAQSIMCADRSRYLMEAERINQIANSLAGLQQRAADLRRYL
jgi:hypothetical protein